MKLAELAVVVGIVGIALIVGPAIFFLACLLGYGIGMLAEHVIPNFLPWMFGVNVSLPQGFALLFGLSALVGTKSRSKD